MIVDRYLFDPCSLILYEIKKAKSIKKKMTTAKLIMYPLYIRSARESLYMKQMATMPIKRKKMMIPKGEEKAPQGISLLCFQPHTLLLQSCNSINNSIMNTRLGTVTFVKRSANPLIRERVSHAMMCKMKQFACHSFHSMGALLKKAPHESGRSFSALL